ncbi:MAG: hypothetical protein M1434_12270 [Chloroflexi bacterium]|nr:hypothetical protein [Chloroflexota bacterium]MCL5275498.1 hypothetical protein [Chloroflexota bacterium]
MEVNLGDTQMVELQAIYSAEQIQGMAVGKRIDAFGQVAKLFQRPKPEDIEIVTIQKQYESFWSVSATAHYIYERKRVYHVDVPAAEVQSVTLQDRSYPITINRTRGIDLDVMERCDETLHRDLTLDGQSGEVVDYKRYLTAAQLMMPDLATLQRGGADVSAPDVRSSFVIRHVIPLLMKTFQADKVLEEIINIESIILCFHAIYAVEYSWAAKQKRQILIFDALTGQPKPASGEMKTHSAKVLENDTLFDIGSDAIGTFIPGANVSIQLGRLAPRQAVSAP